MMLTASTVRAVKGAAASIILLLMVDPRGGNQEWLERYTGYTDKPVSAALSFLFENGMTKIRSADEIKCNRLLEAYQRAKDRAFNQAVLPGGEVEFDGTLGNDVSLKGTLVGKGSCAECGKGVTVTLNLPKVEVKEWESGKPINLFSVLSCTESIKVSGHRCIEQG